MQDAALLRRYAESGSEDAFAALVNECLPLVYGAALRRVGGDVHLAQDVTQMVFTAVARDAPRLAKHPDLTGWLFTTTRFLSAKVVRTERRRQAREHAWLAEVEAAEARTPQSPRLQTVLDDVLMELQQLDREMLLLRFYRGLRLAEIGARLNSSENAVQKRIERALDRLKSKLSNRGITSTATAIAVVLEAHGAVSVPAGLAAAATTAGLACGAGAAGALGFTGATVASKAPLAVAAALVVASSAGLVWYHQENTRLRTELAVANARQASMQTAKQTNAPSETPGAPAAAASFAGRGAARVTASEQSTRDEPQRPPTGAQIQINRATSVRRVAAFPTNMSEKLVLLKIDYPKPLFAGTPRPVGLPNLEPANVRLTELLVPVATTLVSCGKPVTSSDPRPAVGELSFITDGDRRGVDGTFVELGPGLQWVQIDLKDAVQIHAIAVWHFHSQARVYHDVIVQVSEDPQFKRDVTTLFNNDHDNSARLGRGPDLAYVETHHGRLIRGRGAVARFVRLYTNGNTSDELNHYCEIEVFGVPARER